MKESLALNLDQRRKKVRELERVFTRRTKQGHIKEVTKWYKKNIKRKNYWKSYEKFFKFFKKQDPIPPFMQYDEA